jgi:hypothetical protein
MTPNPPRSTPLDAAEPSTEAPKVPPVDGQKIDDHTGATDAQVGDRTGPGAGFDQEPKQDQDKSGVAPS